MSQFIVSDDLVHAQRHEKASGSGFARLAASLVVLALVSVFAGSGWSAWSLSASVVGGLLVLVAGRMGGGGLNRELVRMTGHGLSEWRNVLSIHEGLARPSWARPGSQEVREARGVVDRQLATAWRTDHRERWSAGMTGAACAIGVSAFAMTLVINRPTAWMRVPVSGAVMEWVVVGRMLPPEKGEEQTSIEGREDGRQPTGQNGTPGGSAAQNPVKVLDPSKVAEVSSEVIEGTLPSALDALGTLQGLDRKLAQAARVGDAQSAREASEGLERALRAIERLERDPNVDPQTGKTLESTREALGEMQRACERLVKSPQDPGAMKEIEDKMEKVLKLIKDCLDALQRLIEALMELMDALFGGSSGMGPGGKQAAGQAMQNSLGAGPGGKSGSPQKSNGPRSPSDLSDLGKKIATALGGTQVVVVLPIGWETRVPRSPRTRSDDTAPGDSSGGKAGPRRRSDDAGKSKTDQKVEKVGDGVTKLPPAAGKPGT